MQGKSFKARGPRFAAVSLLAASTLLFAASTFAAAARADFAAGARAFQAGDFDTAYAEWLPLAQAGGAAAQYNIGVMHLNGIGVAEDPGAAATWFQLAARQGHRDAQLKLGVLLFNGKGVAQDRALAARWTREAAERGHAQAQFNLGIMYATGLGVAPDPVQSLMWVTLADDAGVEAARDTRAKLEAQMTATQIEEARLLAETLGPDSDADASASIPLISVTSTLAAARATAAPPASSTPAPSAAGPVTDVALVAPPPPRPARVGAIRLASYLSRDAAEKGWEQLSAVHGDLLAGLGSEIVAEQAGQNTVYQLHAGPMASLGQAEALCAQLKRRDLFCAPAF